jgi:hypothetical protein
LSFSFREPEEPATCECKYDEIHDRMDREDCPFHFDLLDDTTDIDELCKERKRPTAEDAIAGASERREKIA